MGNNHSILARLHWNTLAPPLYFRAALNSWLSRHHPFHRWWRPPTVYIQLKALLGVFARVYFYDRAGCDSSEMSPIAHLMAEDAAAELHALLTAVNVAPPYVLISHSYECLIARGFLALENRLASMAPRCASAPIAGMVLTDAATEMV